MSFAARWNQRRIDPDACALRRRMNAQIDSGMSGVGLACALIDREIDVVIPQKQRGDPAIFQLLPQLPGEGEGDVFFRQLIVESRSSFVAAVARVNDGKILSRTRCRSPQWSLRRSTGGGRGSSG